MKKFLIIISLVTFSFIFFVFSCTTENLKIIADLPYTLKEVSGTEITKNSDMLWMVNDAGNSSILYGLDEKGNILKELKINAKNKDWEELTSDDDGNLYIGDFGNNDNDRKNLAILKIKKEDLDSDEAVDVEKIKFHYPDQKKFPPKKSKQYFDCEALFFLNDSLYFFTKSRVDDNHGKTTLYKVPAKKGNYEAIKIASYTAACNSITCWTTSADISPDKTKVALLTPNSILIFTDFKDDNFFSGKVTEIEFEFITQKESICFKDNNTFYITDEYTFGLGGNLYKYKLE